MKKLISLALALVMLLSLSSVALAELIWSDEFDGDSLSSDWRVQTGTISGKNGAQRTWSADQIEVADGVLTINGNWDASTNTWSTASMVSTNTKVLGYGYYETRMLVPFHAGSYSFLNIRSERWGGAYGMANGAPTHGFESTILQMGNSPYNISGTIGEQHAGGSVKNQTTINSSSEVNIFDGEYHTFGYEWTQHALNYYIDGVLVYTISDEGLGSDFTTNIYPGSGTNTWITLAIESQGWSGLGDYYFDNSDMQLLMDYIRYYDAMPEPEPVPDATEWIGYPNNTIGLSGLSMADLGISSDWQNIVPVDLTQDATYTYPLVVGDMFYIGTAIVTVSGGVPSVELQYFKPANPYMFSLEIHSEKIKWFTSFDQVNARGLRSAATEVDFTGCDVAYLYIANKGTWMYPYGAGPQLTRYYRNLSEVKAYRAELMKLIPVEGE